MCLYYPEVKGGGEATVIILCTSYNLASFPGSRAGEEEREPGTHCLRMRHAPSSLGNLHAYYSATLNYGQFCLPAERQHCVVILPLRLMRVVYMSKAISLRR